MDQFGYETLKAAAEAMMERCYERGEGGVVDPTGNGVVFLSTRWRDGNAVREGGVVTGEGEGGWVVESGAGREGNVTVVMEGGEGWQSI